jgi:hypothetical protein
LVGMPRCLPSLVDSALSSSLGLMKLKQFDLMMAGLLLLVWLCWLMLMVVVRLMPSGGLFIGHERSMDYDYGAKFALSLSWWLNFL